MRIKIKNRIFYLSRSIEKPTPIHESTAIDVHPQTERKDQLLEQMLIDHPAKLVKCLESSSDDFDVDGIINQTLNVTMANDSLNLSNLILKYK